MQRKINNKISSSKPLAISSKLSIAIVVSEFNSDITRPMMDAAKLELIKQGVKEKNIEIVMVPGGFEIPLACQRLAIKKKCDGIIAIGCVIRGDTDHYVYIANEATRGVMETMLKYNIPIANAILTVNNLEQAKIRSNGEKNKGIEAARALLEMLK